MSATIEFQDGTRATLKNGRWTCDVPALAEVLRLRTADLPVRHRPWPEADLARDMAAIVGAKLIAADPPPEESPDDAIF